MLIEILPSTATSLPFFTYSPANSACLSQTSILNQSVTFSLLLESHLFTANENVVLTYDSFATNELFAGYYLTDTAGNKIVANSSYIPEGEDPDDYIIDEDLLKTSHFINCLQDGIYFVTQINDEGEIDQKALAGVPSIHEVYDTADDAVAEADYETKMATIQRQDKQLEMEAKKIETKHKAIETEIESVSKVIDKNIESGFKTFG